MIVALVEQAASPSICRGSQFDEEEALRCIVNSIMDVVSLNSC